MPDDSLIDDDITVVLHGFLNLAHLQKLRLVEAINDYFDSNDRDPIRAGNEQAFASIDISAGSWRCKCCGRAGGSQS
jgi:hypothetical protein